MSDEKHVSPRIEYFDALRVLATLAVVVLHLSAQNWASIDVTSRAWFAFNLYDSAVRWSVPVFVMISGALFLGREISIRTIWKKNILRIATAFVFWSAVYALIDLLHYHASPAVALKQFLTGHYHMWFLFMIVPLYLIVPLLQKFCCDRPLMRYFLLLSLIFAFFLPQLAVLLSFVSPGLSNTLNTILSYTYFDFVLGFTAYFVGGYYLSRRAYTRYEELVIYLAGIIGFLFTVYATLSVSLAQNAPSVLFYSYETLNVLVTSAAVFVFAKQHLNFPRMGEKARRVLHALSKYSFGAYLCHAMLIELLNDLFGLNTLSCNAFFSVPLITLIVSVGAFLISALIHQIPFFKKYIV